MRCTQLVLFGVLVLGGIACTRPVGNAVVTIEQFQITPSALEITAGTTVVWTNRDAILHTVTTGTTRPEGLGVYAAAPDGLLDGRLDGANTTFRFTFDRPGTYAYFCDRHRHMTATVVVK